MSDETSTDEQSTEKPKSKSKRQRKAELDKLAVEVLDEGLWGTGRERDERLRAAGHDPNEVRRAVYALRGQRLRDGA